MKIATWNLERARPESIKAEQQQQWLSRIDADLWILTETHLEVTPGPNYHAIASDLPDDPSGPGERWVQIWARREYAIAPLATSNQTCTACAEVELPSGQQCLVYGTVLPSLEDSDQSTEAFAAAVASQQTDWQRLQATYPEASLIVAGDFNQDLNTLHYYGSRRQKQALRQALAAAGLECLTAGENDPIHRLLNGQNSNIDHICVPPSLLGQFQSSFAWPPRLDDLRGLSDHFGVGVELEFEA